MNFAHITPEVARWARDRAAVSVEQLAGAINVDSRTLAAWEAGKQLPPFGKAEKLAEKLHIPFGYLFLSAPPDDAFQLPDLRTVGNLAVAKPSLNFIEVVEDTVFKQQWYSEYLEEIGARGISLVGSCGISNGVQEVAQKMSRALGINKDARANAHSWQEFLSYIVQQAEALGILVMQRGIVGNNTRRPLDVNEFRGFAIADKYAPFVTNRLLRFGELWWDTRSQSYNLTVGELDLNDADKTKSTGFLYPEAELVVNKQGELQWNLVGNPWKLIDIIDWKVTPSVN